MFYLYAAGVVYVMAAVLLANFSDNALLLHHLCSQFGLQRDWETTCGLVIGWVVVVADDE